MPQEVQRVLRARLCSSQGACGTLFRSSAEGAIKAFVALQTMGTGHMSC